MKPMLIAIALAGAAYLAPVSAEAARCGKGQIYRPSAGVCQSKATAARQGIRIYSKASIRHRYKRPSVVRRARAPAAPIVAASPTPVTMPRSPMMDSAGPMLIAAPVRPAWLSMVDIYDNFHAQAWLAESERGTP